MATKKTNVIEHASPRDLENQENLFNEVLNRMIAPELSVEVEKLLKNSRPKENFLNLMDWGLDNFKYALKDKSNLNKYVHNRIIIDGQFLLFCKEKSISVKCLYKDSIISWKTEHDFEKFFIQGVFLIKSKNVEFLHAALFHKGNQHEDEISFFIIASNKNYDEYIKLRNSFDDWIQKRDRSNSHIRVVDGEDAPYSKDDTWEGLFLPNSIKNELQSLVENFLSSKEFYDKNKIPWKRGILLYGKPGCHVKGTNILMYDGSWKKVEDIIIGDLLMGPDSNPREVLKLINGKENIYNIIPNKGESFLVNENHILHLNYSSKQKNFPSSTNISVKDFLNLSKSLKEKLKLVKSPELIFNKNEFLELEPYMLGLWLGSGTTGKPEITSADNEIIEYCKDFAIKNNLNCKIHKLTNNKESNISFSHKGDEINHFTNALKQLEIFNKKQIPKKYLTASANDRLALLAGIIDTDGSYNVLSLMDSEKYNKKSVKGCFDIIQKDYNISKQIEFLTLSLGLGFTIKPNAKAINFNDNYFKMSIYGDIYKIPTILPRKKLLKKTSSKNCKNIEIKAVECIGVDDYYGFIIDKDHLYIMDNFWVQHNCGKTSIIRTVMSMYNFKPVTIVPGANDDAVREAFLYAEEQSPSLLYFEDLDSMLEKNVDVSSFLNLMDGISAKNGLLIIATANDVTKLKANITDRPSRFDRKFEIPLPTQEMAYIYLKRWFGPLLSVKKCKELSKYAAKSEFSYAYLKELYISSMFEAMAHNRKSPTEKDIENSLNRLIKDKNILNASKMVNTDKYFK